MNRIVGYILRSLACICIAASVILAVLAFQEYIPIYNSKKLNRKLVKITINNDVGSKDPLDRQIDFKELSSINSDIIGWIYIPDTTVDYPILRGKDLSYYLNHAYDGSYNVLGSVFTHPDAALSDQHIILYGHRTNAGLFFADVLNYETREFAANHPVYIYTPEVSKRYDVYAAYQCSKTDDTYNRVNNTEEASSYLSDVEQKAVYYETLSVEQGNLDDLLTLSTCPPKTSAVNRFVVQLINVQTVER